MASRESELFVYALRNEWMNTKLTGQNQEDLETQLMWLKIFHQLDGQLDGQLNLIINSFCRS